MVVGQKGNLPSHVIKFKFKRERQSLIRLIKNTYRIPLNIGAALIAESAY
jgi:hypothetical protein